uniref:Coiled-coil domain-containing protein n=1 Tax=Daphnia magna TaxID=35525 RepID=A0A0P5AMI3_9CRUS
MDLRQKVIDLLTLSKEVGDLPSSVSSPAEEQLGLSLAEIKSFDRDSLRALQDTCSDPDSQQEVFDTIEAGFVDENCNGGRYQLNKFPSVIDLNYIRHQRQLLGIQLGCVTNKLYTMIYQKQTCCASELCKVLELQENLDSALEICTSGRNHINQARSNLTAASLGLLAHYRRQHHLRKITKSLKTIQTLGKMNERVQELLGEQNYAAAIQLIVEGQHVATTYRHFHCVAQLSSRLQDTMELAEEQLDVGLSKSCKEFDSDQYGKLQQAFTLLGKQSAAIDQLNLHFASGLQQQTLLLLQKYAELSCSNRSSANPDVEVATDFHKFQFHELCKFIASKLYVACLSELSTTLWKITLNYNQIHQWHTDRPTVDAADIMPSVSFEQKFQHGRTRLWQDVQMKIRTLLSSFDVWHLSTDELLDMLDIVETLVEMGKQFCQSNSDVLRESVRQQSINYFRGFHRGKLDELHVFLENESWEQCPVRSDFNVFQLIEFRFLNQKDKSLTCNVEKPSDANFYALGSVLSPFLSRAISSAEDAIVSPSEISESTCECNDERKIGCGSPTPILANTTLSVLRLFGRYIHFMHLLKTIAFDVLICLNQLFDYYLYAVCKLFGAASPQDATSPKLRAVLLKIEETLISTATPGSAGSLEDAVAFSPSLSDKVSCPKVCLSSQTDHPNHFFGLKLRLVAAESVVFLARQLELLRPNLLDLIPSSKESLLQQFFSQITSVAHDLRTPIFSFVAHRYLDSEHVTNMMSRVQWEVKEVMSQHSSYVDHILQVLSDYDSSVLCVCYPQILPPEIYNILWDQILRACYHALLDGFSAVRKCTNEGRALMQLDFRHFQVKVESLTRLRPLPDPSIVETYIKAYYLPENSLEKWIQEQTEYTPRQMMNLLQCVSQGSKKIRLNLTSFMEDLDLNRR